MTTQTIHRHRRLPSVKHTALTLGGAALVLVGAYGLTTQIGDDGTATAPGQDGPGVVDTSISRGLDEEKLLQRPGTGTGHDDDTSKSTGLGEAKLRQLRH